MADLPLAMILVGGLGSRIQSVVKDRPKALAKAGGTPFLDIQLQWLTEQGGREAVLLTGHKGKQIKEYVIDRSARALTVSCLQEDSPLGTGGALLNAVKEMKHHESFLLLNGDSLTDVSLSEFCCDRLEERCARLVVVYQDDATRYGTVQFDENKQLIGFKEKKQASMPGWINTGIYFFPDGWFVDLPNKITPCSLEQDLFPQWLRELRRIHVFPVQGNFIDIGTPDSLAKFRHQHHLWTDNPKK